MEVQATLKFPHNPSITSDNERKTKNGILYHQKAERNALRAIFQALFFKSRFDRNVYIYFTLLYFVDYDFKFHMETRLYVDFHTWKRIS